MPNEDHYWTRGRRPVIVATGGAGGGGRGGGHYQGAGFTYVDHTGGGGGGGGGQRVIVAMGASALTPNITIRSSGLTEAQIIEAIQLYKRRGDGDGDGSAGVAAVVSTGPRDGAGGLYLG